MCWVRLELGYQQRGACLRSDLSVSWLVLVVRTVLGLAIKVRIEFRMRCERGAAVRARHLLFGHVQLGMEERNVMDVMPDVMEVTKSEVCLISDSLKVWFCFAHNLNFVLFAKSVPKISDLHSYLRATTLRRPFLGTNVTCNSLPSPQMPQLLLRRLKSLAASVFLMSIFFTYSW